MAAATVNIPAIVLSVGPMLNGWWKGERSGSGTIVWKAREMMAAGEIDYEEFIERRLVGALGRPLQHHGHGLDDELAGRGARHELPGCAAIPAPYRERGRSPTRPASASSRWCGRT
jgi:dihydroxy-acid dehydratase